MNISSWHVGKIGLMWLGVLLAYAILRSMSNTWLGSPGVLGLEEPAFLVFLAITGAASTITWKWFSSREGQS